MNIKALVNCNADIQSVINELNGESKICKYEFLRQTNLSISPDMIIIIFEIIKNLGINATYDLVKMALLEIISKICTKKQGSMSKMTSIIVIVNDKRTEVDLSFELNEEQKNKVVDAAIKKLFD